MKLLSDYSTYEKHYSSSALWKKVKKVAKRAKVKVVYLVLLLYYVAMDESVSKADKAKIYGALGYFILPLDLIPDLAPIVGYTDDMSALLWALHTVWKNVTPEIKEKARAKLKDWFGKVDEAELQL